MRIYTTALLLCALGLAGIAQAQEWELGGIGGAGLMNGMNIARAGASATTGFRSGAALGAFAGSNLYSHLSGEIRYTYQMSDLKLSGNGSEVTFTGVAHVIHYDFLYHPANKRSKMQPFVAAGAGIKL